MSDHNEFRPDLEDANGLRRPEKAVTPEEQAAGRMLMVFLVAVMLFIVFGISIGIWAFWTAAQFETPDSPEATTQTDPNTFPEDMSDRDYSGSNGSDAESYCSEINSPDMEACQDGYNNLADSLSGG